MSYITSSPKSYLFLQGVATPFFAQLSEALMAQGHACLRINFCGGDWLFASKNTPSIDYTGRLDNLQDWILTLIRRHQITDVILFGDTRPIHAPLLPLFQTQNLTVHVFEEGYLRPHWITLEKGGVNALSPFMGKAPEFWLEEAAKLPTPEQVHPTGVAFRDRALNDFIYRLANGLLSFRYRHYISHRQQKGHWEYLGWAIRFSRNALWQSTKDAQLIGHLIAQQVPFYFLPLQLESDAQIRIHSRFNHLSEVMEEVLGSFAQHAPSHTQLLVKNHPLDTGLKRHDIELKRLATKLGIADRVLFIETGSLHKVLRHCLGTILVNSTTATAAFEEGSPVIALGDAMYNLPGLCFQQGLDAFWTQAQPADPKLLHAFTQVLKHETLINGDFYSPQGIRMAVHGSLDKLGAKTHRPARIKKNVLITGASRGLGAALASAYAKPGVRLGLIGRDQIALEKTQDLCRKLGAEVEIGVIDVRDAPTLKQWIDQFDAAGAIDLLITSAGISHSLGKQGELESLDEMSELLAVNLQGTLNATAPVIEKMQERKQGQIALISSLAAYFGMPITPSYSASKAAIKSYGEAMRSVLAAQGIRVNIVCPGFVETHMSDRFPGPRPFLISAEQAAQRIIKGLESNQAIIAFPQPLSLGMKCLQWMPYPLAAWFLKRSGYHSYQTPKKHD